MKHDGIRRTRDLAGASLTDGLLAFRIFGVCGTLHGASELEKEKENGKTGRGVMEGHGQGFAYGVMDRIHGQRSVRVHGQGAFRDFVYAGFLLCWLSALLTFCFAGFLRCWLSALLAFCFAGFLLCRLGIAYGVMDRIHGQRSVRVHGQGAFRDFVCAGFLLCRLSALPAFCIAGFLHCRLSALPAFYTAGFH